MHKSAQVVTDYIHFCVDSDMPEDKKAYPNNTHYITNEVKDWINCKRQEARGNHSKTRTNNN